MKKLATLVFALLVSAPFAGFGQCSGRYEITYPSGSATATTSTNNGNGHVTATFCPSGAATQSLSVKAFSASSLKLEGTVGTTTTIIGTASLAAGATKVFGLPAAASTVQYTLTSTIACNNPKPETFALTLSPTLTLAGPATVCAGSSATLTAQGSTGRYTWTAPGLTTVTNAGALTVAPAATTTYTVAAPTACGAATQQSITVVVPSLTATGSSPTVCSSSSVLLSAESNVAGATFTWTAGGTTVGTGAAITVSPTASTTYRVTSSNPSGCASTATRDVAVTVAPQTTEVTPASPSITQGSSVTVTAASNISGATYAWHTGGSTGPTIATGAPLTVSPTQTTTYTVTSAAGSCRASQNVTVTVTKPLPVELAAFTARRAGPVAILSWNTATEHGNDYFAVERSADGKAFAALARVAGAGESSGPRAYSFTDEQPLAGGAYYRLQQMDYDGAATYSPVVAIAPLRQVGDWLVPASPARHYVIQGVLDAGSRFAVLDVLGRPVFAQAVAPGRAEVTLPALPAGVYLFQLATQQGRLTLRRVVPATE